MYMVEMNSKTVLSQMPCQTAAAPLVLSDAGEHTPASIGALAATFHISKADLEWFARKSSLFSPSRRAASLKVAVYAGHKGTTCGVSYGRLLGKATISREPLQPGRVAHPPPSQRRRVGAVGPPRVLPHCQLACPCHAAVSGASPPPLLKLRPTSSRSSCLLR